MNDCEACEIRANQLSKIIDLGLIINDKADEIHELRQQRDRARDIAVSLEQEIAQLLGRP